MYVILFTLFAGAVTDSHVEPQQLQAVKLYSAVEGSQPYEGNLLLLGSEVDSAYVHRGACVLTDEDAKVACKMLGYSTGKANNNQYGNTYSPYFQNFGCTGAESSLYDCPDYAAGFRPAGCDDPVNELGGGIICGAEQCQTGGYETFTDSKRLTSYVSGSNWKCDKTGVATVSSDWMGADKWYRFEGDAGKILAQQPSIKKSCGTNVNGWSPTIITGLAVGQTKDLSICYGTTDDPERKPCYKTATGEVTNCGDFYVYKLPDTPGCHMRYCGADA